MFHYMFKAFVTLVSLISPVGIPSARYGGTGFSFLFFRFRFATSIADDSDQKRTQMEEMCQPFRRMHQTAN